MKLYITPGSPYARMARIVVIEKDLGGRVEVIVARTRAPGSLYYQINPSGRVPYLIRDDGVGMTRPCSSTHQCGPSSFHPAGATPPARFNRSKLSRRTPLGPGSTGHSPQA